MANGLDKDDVLKALDEIQKLGFGRIEVVIVNGGIKTINATKTIAKQDKKPNV